MWVGSEYNCGIQLPKRGQVPENHEICNLWSAPHQYRTVQFVGCQCCTESACMCMHERVLFFNSLYLDFTVYFVCWCYCIDKYLVCVCAHVCCVCFCFSIFTEIMIMCWCCCRGVCVCVCVCVLFLSSFCSNATCVFQSLMLLHILYICVLPQRIGTRCLLRFTEVYTLKGR